MAEIKHNFLKSKMNKDLDDRIMPNGEYRDATNVAVSKSESSDVGALENVLGNALANDLGLSTNCGVTVIGKYMDDTNNRMIIFVTDYTDSSPDRLSNFATSTSVCKVLSYYPASNTVITLIRGNFLNFSKTHFIEGINVIEDLLFWSDNRNQPRKINITSAESDPGSYYDSEDEISVAKYYPWKPIDLYKDDGIPVSLTEINAGTNYSIASPLNTSVAPAGGTGLTVNVSGVTGGAISGISIVAAGSGYTNGDIITVLQGTSDENATYRVTTGFRSSMFDRCNASLPDSNVTAVTVTAVGTGYTPGAFTGQATTGGTGVGLTLSGTITAGGEISGTPTIANAGVGYSAGDIVILNGPGGSDGALRLTVGATTNPDYDPNWPGDCQYLKDRFVRFSYRFKFDDNEYSLLAPFTQLCFVPEQDGYFIAYDEDKTFKSSEVSFMKNKISEISLMINSPTGVDWDEMFEKLKITELDIIYKESDGLSLKVVETIKAADFPTSGTILEYKYQSKKPTKVLPEQEIIRVSDKVPVRAIAQSVSGNRVIYGNYADKHSSPASLDYNVSAGVKNTEAATPASYVRKEYQNHTLKQNRNYQVGIILCDRYGRQSDIILSSADTSISSTAKGSTLFHGYKDSTFTNANLISQTDTWPGDSLKVTFNTLIPSTVLNEPGYPGLYSSTNPLGWYSYKVVVKQNQTSYYNVYFPGILNGFTQAALPFGSSSGPATVSDPIGHIVLIGDNVNKVPKDLENDGPNQNQFASGRPSFDQDPSYYQFDSYVNDNGELIMGQSFDENSTDPEALAAMGRRDAMRSMNVRNSSVLLYGRVTNFMISGNNPSNKRINPGTSTDNVVTIATATDLALVNTAIAAPELYLADTNPYIGRVELSDISVGASYSGTGTTMEPFLAVYETEPVVSQLDIFWETSTSGLISELNTAITDSDSNIPSSLDTPTTNIFPESRAPGGAVTNTFYSRNDTTILASATMVLDSVIDGNGTNVTQNFSLASAGGGGYSINLSGTSTGFYFGSNINANAFTAYVTVTNSTYVESFSFPIYLSNIAPTFNTVISSPASASTSGGSIGTYEAYNGANLAALKHNGCKIRINSQVLNGTSAQVKFFYLTFTSTGFATLNNLASTPAGTYDLVIKVVDGGGLSTTTSLQVVVS